MIVGKFEEIYPPVLKDYVSVCDNAYTGQEILEMEAQILQKLGFDLCQTSSFQFLSQLQEKLSLEKKAFCLALYILENALMDVECH